MYGCISVTSKFHIEGPSVLSDLGDFCSIHPFILVIQNKMKKGDVHSPLFFFFRCCKWQLRYEKVAVVVVEVVVIVAVRLSKSAP